MSPTGVTPATGFAPAPPSAPDGTDLTVPSLLAVVTGEPRILFLQRTGATSAPLEEAAFSELLEQAVQA